MEGAVSMPNGFALQVGCPSGCQGSNLGVLPLFSLLSFSSYPSVLWNGSPCMASAHIQLSPLSFSNSNPLFPCPWNFSQNFKSCTDFSIEPSCPSWSLKHLRFLWLFHSVFLSVCLSFFYHCPTIPLPLYFSSSYPLTMALVFKILSRTCISNQSVCTPSTDTFWFPGVLTNLVPLTHLSLHSIYSFLCRELLEQALREKDVKGRFLCNCLIVWQVVSILMYAETWDMVRYDSGRVLALLSYFIHHTLQLICSLFAV